MKGPGVAVDAAMLAAAVGVDTRVEADVRTLIISDDGARAVFEELGARQGILFRVPIGIGFEMDFLEAVGRVAGRPARGRRCWTGWHRGIVIHRPGLSSGEKVAQPG